MEKFFKRYKIKSTPFNVELLSSILWEVDIEGIHEEDDFLYLFALQKSNINKEVITNQLNKLLKEKLITNFQVEEGLIQNKNWNEEWEKTIRVVKVSDRIVIKPSFREYEKQGEEIVITIDPKMSFGTGEHATTRLVILMLEKYLKSGVRILDVGSGTGILSIAAIKLGASSALAIDNDDWCFENAVENCKLNNVEKFIEISNCEIADVDEKDFSLIISNIQKNILKQIAPEFKKRIKQNGVLILSGILDVDRDEMIKHYSSLGFKILDFMQIDEWITLAFKLE